MSLRKKVLSSFGWSFLSEIAGKVISPITFIILAKILAPEDFGVVAAAMILVSFSQIICEAGFSKVIIQRKEIDNTIINTALWMNLALGSTLFIAIILLADQFALLFKDTRVTNVVKLLSIQILLTSVSAIFIAVQQRDFNFKNLFLVRAITSFLPAIVSIPYALNGGGYWAIVFATIFASGVQLAILWWQCRWTFSLSVNWLVMPELLNFSRWVILSAFLGWLFLWLDGLIIGSYLGLHELGLYRTANLTVAAIFALFISPISPVLYSMLAEFSSDLARIKKLLFLINRLLFMVAAPIGITLLLTDSLVSRLLFDERWEGIGSIIGILGLSQALAFSVSFNQEAYKAIARPDVETKIMAISMLIRLPFYLLSISYGLYVFTVARLLSTFIGVLNHLYFAKMVLGIPVSDYFKCLKSPAIASACVCIAGHYAMEFVPVKLNDLTQLIFILSINMITYLLVLFLIDRTFVSHVVSVIRGNTAFH